MSDSGLCLLLDRCESREFLLATGECFVIHDRSRPPASAGLHVALSCTPPGMSGLTDVLDAVGGMQKIYVPSILCWTAWRRELCPWQCGVSGYCRGVIPFQKHSGSSTCGGFPDSYVCWYVVPGRHTEVYQSTFGFLGCDIGIMKPCLR